MTVRIQTTAAATFTATGNWSGAPTYSTAWIRVGATDYFLGSDDFTAPDTLESGDSYSIPSGTTYDFTFTPDDATAGSGDEALARLMNAGADEVQLRFSLHDGDPGNAGTANELDSTDEPGYERQAAAFEVVNA